MPRALIERSSCERWTLECEQVPPKKHLDQHAWEALTERVFERDRKQAWLRTERLRLRFPLSQVQPKEACVARFLDPSESERCWGSLTFNHVHRRGETAMQKKAADDEQHLVTLCEGHHGHLTYSGGWANTKAAIELERAYLEELYPELRR